MYADEILANIEQSEKVWPHNAHLLNHFRIEDYVRLALRDRDDAMIDGQALIPPMGVAADLHHDFVSYPFEDPASMLASMDLCKVRGRECGAAAFVCATCSRSIPGPRKPNDFEIVWVSAPPSVVGVALCATCAPTVIAAYAPVRI
ncbi:hypothetical protein [Rhodococcoides kyotonense]|uniref:Uncharacterized protein n=1 Tax=Rhodococcoides kyotonense TaxID=398843 RepID=A0A239F365_9NOCA|nr:hypothetical protein [Rhodococcus kyotonensis]SNS50612.1 hypothetical protein SAMN05421642_10352 [Rhodococcus kyotonensis]